MRKKSRGKRKVSFSVSHHSTTYIVLFYFFSHRRAARFRTHTFLRGKVASICWFGEVCTLARCPPSGPHRPLSPFCSSNVHFCTPYPTFLSLTPKIPSHCPIFCFAQPPQSAGGQVNKFCALKGIRSSRHGLGEVREIDNSMHGIKEMEALRGHKNKGQKRILR